MVLCCGYCCFVGMLMALALFVFACFVVNWFGFGFCVNSVGHRCQSHSLLLVV